MKYRMSEAFSASGFFVQTPSGPRKSGIPLSVEMPAPVSTVTEAAPATRSAAARTAASSVPAGGVPRSSIAGASQHTAHGATAENRTYRG